MNSVLRYRAGSRARALLRSEGLRPEIVRAIVGPASGPKWLVLSGIDRALLSLGFPAAPYASGRRLLVGSSAGAWRMLAFACRDAETVHRRLLHGYIHQVFPDGAVPATVSAAYHQMLDSIFHPDERRHLLNGNAVDVAVHVARARGALPWDRPRVQTVALAVNAALHMATGRGTGMFFERLLFHSRPEGFAPGFDGRVVALDEDNFIDAATASGTVPFYMRPQRDLAGAPRGFVFDGGILDYHLRHPYADDGHGVVLLPHFRRAVHPIYFDRYPPRRETADGVLESVLQLYPSDAFVASLPGGSLPDQDDFLRWIDDPDRRIRGWKEAVARSEALGEQLLRDLETGDWADRIDPI